MRTKKIAALCITMGILALLPTGCGDTIQSEEEIVVLKEDAGEPEPESHDGEEIEEEAAQGNENGIAELVQAPEQYSWEESSGGIQVRVDAPVRIPQADGFKPYKVTGRVFTQADYDQVNRVLLKGEKLWDKDYQAEKKGLSEEPALVEVPAVVSYRERQENEEVNVESFGGNWLYGYATVENEDYFVSLDNDLREDWRWISFAIRGAGELSNYYPAGEKPEFLESELPTEAIRQEAEQLMADMEFTDFAVGGEEYFCAVSSREKLRVLQEKGGYGIHFTRTLDGIPVTYTANEGTVVEVENGAMCPWPYEKIDMVFDEEGLAEFVWTNPYEVEKLSDENVFLLPFSDIQNVFQEMIFKKYQDFWGETRVEEELCIREVRLGYMRIMEKGNVMEGSMVPVWDFFGSETFCYDEMEEPVTEDSPYKCLLTVNAMDGTIIDRDLGY